MNNLLKFLTLALAITSPAVMLTSCGGNAADPWDYSMALPIPELTLADHDKSLFTGLEWTGKTRSKDIDGNPVKQSDVIRINALDHHAVGTVVFDSVENALNGAREYNRTLSPYYKLLTGEGNTWQLAVYKNEEEAIKTGLPDSFYKPDFDMSNAPKYDGEIEYIPLTMPTTAASRM